MKRVVLIAVGVLAIATSAFAQTTEEIIDRALAAAPRQIKDATTVIKWKPDYTYETLKKGANRLVCYDLAGEPGQQPFSVECTSIANLERVAQNRKIETIADKAARQAAFDAAEKDGTRLKPEFGSVWIHLRGPDREHARMHTTIAVPGATTKTLGLPENANQGGVWIMEAGTSTAHLMTPGS